MSYLGETSAASLTINLQYFNKRSNRLPTPQGSTLHSLEFSYRFPEPIGKWEKWTLTQLKPGVIDYRQCTFTVAEILSPS